MWIFAPVLNMTEMLDLTHLGSVEQLDLNVSELLRVADIVRPVLITFDEGEPVKNKKKIYK